MKGRFSWQIATHSDAMGETHGGYNSCLNPGSRRIRPKRGKSSKHRNRSKSSPALLFGLKCDRASQHFECSLQSGPRESGGIRAGFDLRGPNLANSNEFKNQRICGDHSSFLNSLELENTSREHSCSFNRTPQARAFGRFKPGHIAKRACLLRRAIKRVIIRRVEDISGQSRNRRTNSSAARLNLAGNT